jgi:hypothetical protein
LQAGSLTKISRRACAASRIVIETKIRVFQHNRSESGPISCELETSASGRFEACKFGRRNDRYCANQSRPRAMPSPILASPVQCSRFRAIRSGSSAARRAPAGCRRGVSPASATPSHMAALQLLATPRLAMYAIRARCPAAGTGRRYHRPVAAQHRKQTRHSSSNRRTLARRPHPGHRKCQ